MISWVILQQEHQRVVGVINSQVGLVIHPLLVLVPGRRTMFVVFQGRAMENILFVTMLLVKYVPGWSI